MFKGMINLLISASYAAVITYMVGKWGFCMAYMERGYEAVGGEYLLIPMTYWAAGGAMHCFINALEEWKHGQNSKKGRSRRTAWKNKQEYIYRQEKRPVILQQWYLLKLTEEYIRSLAFSEKTADLCRMLRNMEKEHPTKSQGAHHDIHIVTSSAL